jgi:hypothetical protein
VKLAAAMLSMAVAVAVAVPALAQEAAVQPSRPPAKGCQWMQLNAPGLGLQLLYQQCAYKRRKTSFVAVPKDGIVYETWEDTGPRDPKDKSPRVGQEPRIQVFTKGAEENIGAAIKRVAAEKQSRRERKHCDPVMRTFNFLNAYKRAYVLTPDDYLAAKLANKAGDDVPPPACGAYGDQPDGLAYFEYHPDESQTRFAYVDFGQDEHPMFDESSLVLAP